MSAGCGLVLGLGCGFAPTDGCGVVLGLGCGLRCRRS